MCAKLEHASVDWILVRRRFMDERLLGTPWAAKRDKLMLARMMRSSPTRSESRLWDALRRSALGFRFRRQHVVAGYIVDFYCPACRLAVEVDGPIHRARHLEDRERDDDLAALGVAVLRVSNERVLTELPRVLAQIVTVATSLAGRIGTAHRSDSLPPLAGEGPGKGA